MQQTHSGTLAGRRVLITGSTRGIGRALAAGFAAAGASVVLHGRREADVAAAVAEVQSRCPSVRIAGVAAELREEGAGARIVERAIAALGAIDLAINNAGIHDPVRKPIWSTTTGELQRLLAVNLVAAFEVSAAVIGHLQAREAAGRILNISTAVANPARITDKGIASYGISKIALEGLSAYLAAELKGDLSVTTLRPSTLATDMVAPLFTPEQRAKLMSPDSIVPAAVYLATAPRDEVHGRVFDQNALTEQLVNRDIPR